MDKLQELQNIWQSHQPEKNIEVESDKISSSVLRKIQQTERKVYRINLLKTFSISILILYIISLFKSQNLTSPVAWAGIGMIAFGSIIMLIFYWKIQFKSSNLNHNLPQNEFIQDAIHQMKRSKENFVKLFLGFLSLMIIGINLLYMDLLKNLDSQIRMIYHIGITGFLVLTFLLGLKIRERKFKKEFQPLIDEMLALIEC